MEATVSREKKQQMTAAGCGGRMEDRMGLSGREQEAADVTLPMNDAERWIAGSCAIWSEYCGGSCQYLGGYEKTKANAKMVAKVLKEDWLVYDHKSGVSMVEYLLENAGSEDDDEDDDGEWDDEDEDDDGEWDDEDEDDDGEWEDEDEDDDGEWDEDDDDDIDTTAFDYACVCNMCGRMLIAGYLTREEAIRYAAEAAKKIQELYDSWEEYFEAYITGAAGGSNIKERAPFEEAYRQVKQSPYNPMNLDWNTRL